MTVAALIEKILPYAPTLATALSGPLAGSVVQLLAHHFNATTQNPEDILSALSGSADVSVQLKKLDNDYQESLIYLQLQQSDAQDRANARDAEIKRQQLGEKINFVHFIALIILALNAANLLAYFYGLIQSQDIIVTRLLDALFVVLTYYFGSTHGERQKKLNS